MDIITQKSLAQRFLYGKFAFEVNSVSDHSNFVINTATFQVLGYVATKRKFTIIPELNKVLNETLPQSTKFTHKNFVKITSLL